MIRRLVTLLAGLLVVSASAAIVEVNLRFKTLRLKDGIVLTDVAVKSFNTVTGTAMLLVEKDLVSVRTSQLPDDLRAKLQEIAPPLTADEQEAEKLQAAADRKKALENAERRQRLAEDEAAAIRAASRDQNVRAAADRAARREALPDEIAKFAESRARAFFRYQSDPHSNIGAVINSDIFLENPEPVPGWGGRWRVEGVAYRQYINNQASGFGRSGQEFEILIQAHESKRPEIIEIRVK
jgi:hypothetical protein